MLRLVEAVDLIEEEDDAVGRIGRFRRSEEAELAAFVGSGQLHGLDDLAEFGLAGGNS